MKYDTLYDEFLKSFPEDAAALNARAGEMSVDPSDGMHIMFGMVIVPFILKLVEDKNEIKLKAAFHFFERMQNSGDALIAEVLEFTVLEDLISREKSVLDSCKAYMESETRKACRAVERFMMS